MGLYNFKARFAAPIRAGKKRHTIRAPRANGREDEPGYMMYLYTGLRTAKAERILPDPPVCIKVESIVIRPQGAGTFQVWVGPFRDSIRENKLRQKLAINYPDQHGLELLDASECELLAHFDGFSSFTEMLSFWQGKLPFYGHIFHWHPAQKLK